jgi:hypothetical protein
MIRTTVQSALCLLLSPFLVAQQVAGGAMQTTSQSDQRSSVPTQSTITVPKGTKIPLVLLESLSSATARKRQLIRFAVARDVMANGTVVIRRGTRALGVVTKSRKAISGKKDGFFLFDLVNLTLPDGPRPITEYAGGGSSNDGDGWCYGFGSCLVLFVFMYAIYLPIVSMKDLFDRQPRPPVSATDETKAVCSPIWAITKTTYPINIASIANSDTLQPAAEVDATCPMSKDEVR